MNVKVLQYMYGDFGHFDWSERINRRYCECHGYDYRIRRDAPRMDRHVCWHKIPLIRDELHDCDYLLYVDADAVFYSHDLSVENELIPLLEDKAILMAQDCAAESLRWYAGRPNTGVILARPDERAKRFFETWDAVSELDEETRWQWPPEQRALWHHVLPRFEEDIRVVEDYYLVHGRYSHFIRHFCLASDEDRSAAMEAVAERIFRQALNH